VGGGWLHLCVRPGHPFSSLPPRACLARQGLPSVRAETCKVAEGGGYAPCEDQHLQPSISGTHASHTTHHTPHPTPPHRGWVAPNIYFLGFAGVVNVGGLRVGGLSGIYRGNNYQKGYFEQHPLTGFDCKSIYNVREFSVARLSLLQDPLHVVMSHDWPTGIPFHGDVAGLKRRKPYFTAEIDRNELGSPVNAFLLHKLRPRYWFSGHLHVKFTATVRHPPPSPPPFVAPQGVDRSAVRALGADAVPALPMPNPDEINIADSSDEEGPEKWVAVGMQEAAAVEEAVPDKDEAGHPPAPCVMGAVVAAAAPEAEEEELASVDPEPASAPLEVLAGEPKPSSGPHGETFFLALDKCLPRRDFLEV
jgi:lariat debranching enzyme